MRDLRALGIAAESYSSLLSPVILSKLPQEFCLIVSRQVTKGRWNLDELMRVIDVDIKVRECDFYSRFQWGPSTQGSRQGSAH